MNGVISPYQVHELPEGQDGNYLIRKVVHGNHHYNGALDFLLDRGTVPGTYTVLFELADEEDKLEALRKGHVWMSDTPAEIKDHMPFFERLQDDEPISVLINGLGIGMALKAALSTDSVSQIDVVEINNTIIELVWPTWEKFNAELAHPKDLRLHRGSAYDLAPTLAKGRWSLVWHDIWPEFDPDNLPDMDWFLSVYEGHAEWQGCWGRAICLMMSDAEKWQAAGRPNWWVKPDYSTYHG